MKKLFLCVFTTFALWSITALFLGAVAAFLMNTSLRLGVVEVVTGSVFPLWVIYFIACVIIAIFTVYQPKDDPNFVATNDLDEPILNPHYFKAMEEIQHAMNKVELSKFYNSLRSFTVEQLQEELRRRDLERMRKEDATLYG